MKKIVYTRPDGGVSVVHPVIGDNENISEDMALQRALSRVPVDATQVTVVDASAIPTDRSKRWAWRQSGQAIIVDASVPVPDPRFAQDEQERQAAKADANIMALVNQTRAQWLSWAGANFPSLTAPEQNRLGNLFWVVAIAARRLLRSAG